MQSVQSTLRIYTIILSKTEPWVNFSRKTLTGFTSTLVNMPKDIVRVIIDLWVGLVI